jgi:hypothetical protein
MKMLECTRTFEINIGFFDPDKVHTERLKTKPVKTARNILRFLKEQHFITAYCFLTTSGGNLTLLYTFTFAYTMLSVIDELLTYI